MKKSILTLFYASLCVGSSFAQSVIKSIPKNTQGYIILQENGVAIECWQVSFSERVWSSNSQFTINPLTSVRVCGKDYVGVPDDFGGDNTRDIVFSVTGFESNGTRHIYDQNVSTGVYHGINGEGGSIRRCGAICDEQRQGYAYAFETYFSEYWNSANPNGTGIGSLMVDIATQYEQDAVNIPYYAYVPTTQIQNHFWMNYGYTVANYQNAAISNPLLMSPVLLTTDLGPGVSLLDPSNQVVMGAYRMIAKNLGPWRNWGAQMQYDNLSLSQECPSTLNFFIAKVNQNPNYNGPDLECYGNGFALQNAQTSQFDADCLPIQSGNMMATLDGFNDVFTILNAIEDCIDPGTSSGNWWDEAFVSFEELFVNGDPGNGNGGSGNPNGDTWVEVFGFSKSRGVYNSGGIVYPGLYRLNFVTSGGNYFPFIIEVKEEQNVLIEQKDMMDVNFFPVPITDNEFTMDLSVGFSGKIKYELLDAQGTVLYTEFLDVRKTTGSETYRVRVGADYIPEGLLFNRFTCPDGSVYSETTIK